MASSQLFPWGIKMEKEQPKEHRYFCPVCGQGFHAFGQAVLHAEQTGHGRKLGEQPPAEAKAPSYCVAPSGP